MRKLESISWIIAATLLAGLAQAGTASPDPSTLFRRGLADYGKEKYQEGVDQFTGAIEHLKESPPFDPALAHYNKGIGYYRLSQPEKAAISFQDALRTPDLQLQARAYFNLGNAQYKTAQQALEKGDLPNAFKLYQAASSNYIQSLRVNSTDHDAKVNYELALGGQVRILQWVAQAMRHVKQGDQLVGEYRFAEAAAWFQQNHEALEKALSLEPEIKKQFDQMSERTSAVAELVTPGTGGEVNP